jgi:hypothetical protein
MNPPDDELQPWSIAKSEWDSVVVRTDRALRMMRWGGITAVVIAVGACIAAFLVPKSLVIAVLVVGGVAVYVAAFAAFALWKSRDARTTLDQVWDARGLICPWCRVRIDETPCTGHGLTRADQPLLVAYWEAIAANDMAAMGRHAHALSSRGNSGTRHRLLTGLGARVLGVIGGTSSWPQTLVVVLVMTGLFVLLYAAALAAMQGRLHAVVGIEFVLMTPLLMFGFVVGLRNFRAPLHCRKCRQLCAAPAPNTCPECGADLTKPESLSRSRSQRLRFLWMIPVGVLAFVVAINAGKLLSVLPVSAQVWLYSGPIKPPFGFFDDVAKKPLTKEEAIAVADLALELSAPGLRISTSGFIGDGVQSGLLPPIYSEKAARAVVKATLTVDTVGDAIVTTIDPLFARSGGVAAAAPRLVFGGVSIDGGAWTNGAAWSLFEDDLDPFLRSRGQLPALPESQLVFTARLEGVAPGRHTVRARCWIVVWGPPWQRYTPNFDESGALIPPAGALGVYPLELEATVTVD